MLTCAAASGSCVLAQVRVRDGDVRLGGEDPGQRSAAGRRSAAGDVEFDQGYLTGQLGKGPVDSDTEIDGDERRDGGVVRAVGALTAASINRAACLRGGGCAPA